MFFHAILCQQDSVSLCCAVIGVLSYVFYAILCQQDSVSLCCAVIGVLSYVFSCYPMSARFCVSVLCCYRCFVLCFFMLSYVSKILCLCAVLL